MTFAQAKQTGYTIAFTSYFRGYVSRRIDENLQPVKQGKGKRKNLLYVELPCFNSSQYALRAYLVKEA